MKRAALHSLLVLAFTLLVTPSSQAATTTASASTNFFTFAPRPHAFDLTRLYDLVVSLF